MKKFLAILLAVWMIFTCTMLAGAEDASEPAEPTDPAVEYNVYEITEDPDFRTLVYMAAGNEEATVLVAGDQIKTYRKGDITVIYYPDADEKYIGEWESAEGYPIAFSLSGKEYYTDICPAADGAATIRGIDFTDFTLEHSADNTFEGWVVFGYDAPTNTLTVCGKWNKTVSSDTHEERDDFYYIIDTLYNLRERLVASVLGMFRSVTDNILEPIRALIAAVKAFLADLLSGVVGAN